MAVSSATNTGTVPGNSSSIENIYDLQGEYSVSNYDIPHRFVAGFTYELPFGRKRRFGAAWHGIENGVLGGWQLSGAAIYFLDIDKLEERVRNKRK